MTAPLRPTAPPPALRSNPDTFSANAEAQIIYQGNELPDWIEAMGDYIEEQAEAALAAALGGDLPSLAGQAGKFLRVNAAGTAPEFVARPFGDSLETAGNGILVKRSAGDIVARILTSEANRGIQLLYVEGGGSNPVINGVTRTAAQWRDPEDTTEAVLSPAKLAAAFNAAGVAPKFACRAWVNFDGTGTPAIRASGNVSSITDNGTGDYTVNFTTAMPDANYIALASARLVGAIDGVGNTGSTADTYTASAVRVRTMFIGGNATGAQDSPLVSVAVYR
ncbi:hypothetical protein DWF04_000015 [Cereibacter sphaeroides f. sp. denitrificans]|nr:hypothetical protein DWF04_16070 [Cereibacter sphaeroides f. sp. denitrificans]